MDLGLGSPLDIVSALLGAGAKIATPFVQAANQPPAWETARQAQLSVIRAEGQSKSNRTMLVIGAVGLAALVGAYFLLRKKPSKRKRSRR